MMEESINRQEEMFLSFRASGLDYVLPLSDIGQIAAVSPEGIPEIPLAGPSDPEKCAVVFQDGEGLSSLLVGKIAGLIQLPPASQFAIPQAARSRENSWIAGIACPESSGSLYYLLDSRKLRDALSGGRNG